MGSIIDDRTKKLMLIRKQRELDMLFAEQEAFRQKTQLRKVKAQTGLEVDGPEQEMTDFLNANPMSSENYSGLDEPTFGAQSWDAYTNPGRGGVGGINFGGGDYSETPEKAFNLRDKLQVYGPDMAEKAKGMLPSLVALAPTLGNFFGGKATQIKARDYYNPHADQIMSLMRNRRMDVQPQLESILSGERGALRNLRGTANSRGELMGNATGIYNQGARQRASVLANKQNVDLGYKGEEAQALMNLGLQQAQAKWQTMDWNQQSLANKRNMWRTGLSQLSQYGQIKELGKNQQMVDEEKISALKDMLGPLAQFMESLGLVQSNLNSK